MSYLKILYHGILYYTYWIIILCYLHFNKLKCTLFYIFVWIINEYNFKNKIFLPMWVATYYAYATRFMYSWFLWGTDFEPVLKLIFTFTGVPSKLTIIKKKKFCNI